MIFENSRRGIYAAAVAIAFLCTTGDPVPPFSSSSSSSKLEKITLIPPRANTAEKPIAIKSNSKIHYLNPGTLQETPKLHGSYKLLVTLA